MVALGSKMASPQRTLGSNHTNRWNIFKNLLFQNHLPPMLEIRYVDTRHCLVVCSNEVPRVQNGLTPGAPVFEASKYIGKYKKKSSVLEPLDSDA